MSDDPVEEIKRRKREELQSAPDQSTSDMPIPLDDAEDFESLVGAPLVVVVDFHADWCGPCKQLAPIVEQLAADTAATVVKVDVDDHSAIAQEWNVRAVPTLLAFADGELVERLTGVQPYDRLASIVEDHAPA